MTQHILIVDDEPKFRQLISMTMKGRGYSCWQASDGQAALEILEREVIDLVLTDIRMPGMNGAVLLEHIKKRWPQLPVIVITAFANLQEAVARVRDGAHDYLSKPFDIEALELSVDKALLLRKTLSENLALRRELATQNTASLIGSSPQHHDLLKQISEVADTRANVLITGETGTGKEVVARALHAASSRAQHLFVAVNCSAIPAELLESELFGHIKGAFTGAHSTRVGHFAKADGGTLFLDEIGDMPLAMQAKILRVLEDRKITPVGSSSESRVDVRIIAATNRNLSQAIANGSFREDLYYRLSVFPIQLTALRERSVDIAALAQHFVQQLAASMGKGKVTISAPAQERLVAHPWPGNVRELKNCIERTLISLKSELIDVGDLPDYLPHTRSAKSQQDSAQAALFGIGSVTSAAIPAPAAQEFSQFDLDQSIMNIERNMILSALKQSGGVQSKAAVLLGIKERSLWHRIRTLDIKVDRGKPLDTAD